MFTVSIVYSFGLPSCIYCIDVLQFVYYSSFDEPFICFPFLAIINEASQDIPAQIFV